CPSTLADQLLLERHDTQIRAAVKATPCGILMRDPFLNALHFRAGSRQRNLRLQPRHHVKNENSVCSRPLFGPDDVGRERFCLAAHAADRSGRRKKTEVLWQHADDSDGPAVDTNDSSDNSVITCKALPEHPPR